MEIALIAFLIIFLIIVLAGRAPVSLPASVRGKARSPVSVLVLVKDQERILEGFLRRLVCFQNDSPEMLAAITVVDRDSRDQTPLILERMTRVYPVRVITDPGGDERGPCRCEVIEAARAATALMVCDLREENAEAFLGLLAMMARGAKLR